MPESMPGDFAAAPALAAGWKNRLPSELFFSLSLYIYIYALIYAIARSRCHGSNSSSRNSDKQSTLVQEVTAKQVHATRYEVEERRWLLERSPADSMQGSRLHRPAFHSKCSREQ